MKTGAFADISRAASSRISDGLREIENAFRGVREVIFLDIPNYFNVGDLLIFLGTLEFLKQRGIKCRRMHNWATFSDRIIDNAPKDAVIILQGGGNFGDIYSSFQNFREYVVKRWPDRRIIVMPQSIHFSDEAGIAKASKIFKSHSNLTMFCRDQESYELSKKSLSDRSYLAPDMAHFLEPELRDRQSKEAEGVLVFRRRDVESTVPNGPRAFDWGDILHWPAKPLLACVRLLQRLEKRRLLPIGISSLALVELHKFVVKRGTRHFAKFKTVDTDRMHAMLLARMLGVAVVAHDNTYGKLKRYGAVWLDGDTEIEWAS